MKKLIMGVDGGGTKSHLALFDEDGNPVSFKARGTLNHEVIKDSFAGLEKALPEFLHDALSDVGASVDDVAYSVFGLAGVDLQWQHDSISAILREAGFKPNRFTLCNDAFLGVPAGCPDGVGICAINGTGSTMAAIDNNGKMFQLGGLGYLTDDCGGSSWFGEQVLGAVYNALFKCAPPSLMTEMMFRHLDVTHKNHYLETLTSRLHIDVFIHEFNRFVFEAADKGDETALDLIRRSAEHYAGGIVYLIKSMDFPEVHVTLAGSVFVKEKVQLLPDLIKQRVSELTENRIVEFRTLQSPPVAGAVFWAAKKAGFDITLAAIKEGLPK
jgi:N-acetylglucosamine kinase-like BadF-type ATPase